MYPIESKALELYKANYRQVATITMETETETITITEADIKDGGLLLNRYCASGERIEVGSAIAGELSLQLNNKDGKFNSVKFEGAELYVTMGVKDDVPTIVKNIEKKLVREYSENVKLKAGVGEYLRRLHSQGARLFVLTASPHIVTDICLKNNSVYDLFERVWSVEDFGMSKSDVNIFYEVARTVGCDVSCINYFDDNLTAVTNSKKAGYFVYGIKDMQTVADIEKIRGLSDYFVESFEDLL